MFNILIPPKIWSFGRWPPSFSTKRWSFCWLLDPSIISSSPRSQASTRPLSFSDLFLGPAMDFRHTNFEQLFYGYTSVNHGNVVCTYMQIPCFEAMSWQALGIQALRSEVQCHQAAVEGILHGLANANKRRKALVKHCLTIMLHIPWKMRLHAFDFCGGKIGSLRIKWRLEDNPKTQRHGTSRQKMTVLYQRQGEWGT